MLPVLLFLVAAAVAAQSTCAPERCNGMVPACPISTGIASAKAASALPSAENIYFRNAAPFAADIIRVDEKGFEVSQCAARPLPGPRKRSSTTTPKKNRPRRSNR